jgi:hypothetical protein
MSHKTEIVDPDSHIYLREKNKISLEFTSYFPYIQELMLS